MSDDDPLPTIHVFGAIAAHEGGDALGRHGLKFVVAVGVGSGMFSWPCWRSLCRESPSTSTRSGMTWPVSCTRPWSQPTSRCGSATATEAGCRRLCRHRLAQSGAASPTQPLPDHQAQATIPEFLTKCGCCTTHSPLDLRQQPHDHELQLPYQFSHGARHGAMSRHGQLGTGLGQGCEDAAPGRHLAVGLSTASLHVSDSD